MSPARAHFVLFLLAAVAGEKPDATNFVMLLADDLGWADVSPPPYPEKALWRTETPQLERMAREGLTLLGYRNASPLCSPSRMALLTGVFPYRFALDGIIRTQNDGSLPRVPTLPATLLSAGFATLHVGKWHMGGVSDLDLTNHARGSCSKPGPLEHGFETALVHSEINKRGLNGTQYVTRMPKPGCCPWHCCMYSRHSEEYLRMEWRAGKADVRWAKKEQWLSDRQAAEAIDFFVERARDGRRFYVNLAFSAPHLPIEGVPPFIDAARRFGESGLPASVRSCDPTICVPFSAEYVSVVQSLDRAVGDVLDALEATQQAASTLVLFASDNGPEEGFGMARPFRGRKRSIYEGGLASPAFLWGPGVVPRGASTRGFVNSVDVFPTALAALGVAFPTQASEPWPPMSEADERDAAAAGEPKYDQAGRDGSGARLFDGVNQWPALVGDASARAKGDALQRERVALWHNEFAQNAARRRDLKLRTIPSGRARGPELYNLSADPTERVNLIDEPRFAEEVEYLRGAIAAFKKTRQRPFSLTSTGQTSRCGPTMLSDITPF